MAGRHAFWLILDGDTPTSFRSVLRDDLIPTLVQLQRKQPAARLQWFERGQLWESPDAAKLALKMRRTDPSPGRGRDWRPGGSHKDPRAKYKLTRDQKRARWKKGIGRKDKPEFGRRDAESARPSPKLNWKPASSAKTGTGEPQKPKLNWKPAPAGGGSRPQKPNWKPASAKSGGFGSRRPAFGGPRRPGFGPKKPRSRGPR
jgi:hypothetical protein